MTERGVYVVQQWEESERGWGTRPDGYSIHRNGAERVAFIAEYWVKMPREVPDEYERPYGRPFIALASDLSSEQIAKVEGSANGARFYDRKMPVEAIDSDKL